MIRTEDLIKHSGIIEYLEERKKGYLKKGGLKVVDNISDELNHIIYHFKKEIENAENRNEVIKYLENRKKEYSKYGWFNEIGNVPKELDHIIKHFEECE